MKRVVRRPSPAMAVAIVALIAALGGSAVAGGVLNKQKVNNIISNRAPGLSVASATSAENAQNAVNAQNATAVGGKSLRWLEMDPGGTILAQSGGFVLSDHSFSGLYFIDAGSVVTGHAILVSAGWGGGLRSGAPIAGPCGTGSAEVNCAPIEADANDGRHIEVNTSDVSNVSADRTFYLLVY
jgi:hypothetical protein